MIAIRHEEGTWRWLKMPDELIVVESTPTAISIGLRHQESRRQWELMLRAEWQPSELSGRLLAEPWGLRRGPCPDMEPLISLAKKLSRPPAAWMSTRSLFTFDRWPVDEGRALLQAMVNVAASLPSVEAMPR